ncbi:hypothetical protein Tco_0831764 [Tanacetum coccineum]
MTSLCSNNFKESLSLKHALISGEIIENLALYDHEGWHDSNDHVKLVKAVVGRNQYLKQAQLTPLKPKLKQFPRTPFHESLMSHQGKIQNQVQCLIEAHLAPTQPTQVNKITTPCEICSGPHDTQYCMEDPEQAFVEYASSRTDEAGGKWYTFKPEQINLGDTYNLSWKSHPNLRWRQPQNSQNNFPNPPNWFQPNGSIPNRSFNNRPQNFNNQSNIEGLVSEFMASQDARLSKFEADFKRQQGEMTNKIDIVLKAITDQIAGTLPSDTVKNPKLGTHPVSSACSYLTQDLQSSTHIHSSINAIMIHPMQPEESQVNEPNKCSLGNIKSNPHPQPDPLASITTEQVRKLNSMLKSLGLVPQSSNTKNIVLQSKEEDGEGMHVFTRKLHVYDLPEGVVRFANGDDEVAYKMPHKIEQYNSLSNLEKEHTKSIYLRNEEDKRRGVDYVMSKILGFYKECLELGPEYV